VETAKLIKNKLTAMFKALNRGLYSRQLVDSNKIYVPSINKVKVLNQTIFGTINGKIYDDGMTMSGTKKVVQIKNFKTIFNLFDIIDNNDLADLLTKHSTFLMIGL